MKKLLRPYFAFFMIGALVATTTSCDKHDHEPHDHDQELITTMVLTMTPQGGGQAVTATFRDIDGPGGQAPVFTPSLVALSANTTYNATISLLNESVSPAEDLTSEIEEKGDEHEFFYVPTNLNLSVSKTDADSKGLPIGLTSQIQTAAGSHGALRVVLKHQPGSKSATSTIQTGETDIDVTYNIHIQ